MKFQFIYTVATIAVAYSNPIGMITNVVIPAQKVVNVPMNNVPMNNFPTARLLPQRLLPQLPPQVAVARVPPQIPTRHVVPQIPTQHAVPQIPTRPPLIGPTRHVVPQIPTPPLTGRALPPRTILPNRNGKAFYTNSPEVKAYFANVKIQQPEAQSVPNQQSLEAGIESLSEEKDMSSGEILDALDRALGIRDRGWVKNLGREMRWDIPVSR